MIIMLNTKSIAYSRIALGLPAVGTVSESGTVSSAVSSPTFADGIDGASASVAIETPVRDLTGSAGDAEVPALEQLSPRAAAETEAKLNPVIFENDVHYRETFPFWSKRKLVVRASTIDVFHAPGSSRNMSLPLDKVIVLRLGNNALQHEITFYTENAYTPVRMLPVHFQLGFCLAS